MSAAAPLSDAPRLSADALLDFIADALAAAGLPMADALTVADLMLEADLTGADAHGVFRLKQYVERLQLGAINVAPTITVNKTAAATALVDGDNAMGHLAVARAMDTAIALAKESGIGWVGLRNSNHAGAAGVYAAMALAHGMIGIYGAVASANHMAPWGGAEPLLGTNPLAVAIPAGAQPPVVLDIATSTVSYGTIKSHRLQNRPLPEGWMVNIADGAPLTDAAKSGDGLLLPLGGYKGAGLALVIGLLAGTLNGAPFGRDVIDFNAQPEAVCNTGQFVVALDVARFLPLADFAAAVDHHLQTLQASKVLPGFEAVRLPGGQRKSRREDRSGSGLALAPELRAQLDELADKLGITPLSARG